jgi:hypothetical protein
LQARAGYFVDTRFIIRPPHITAEDVYAARMRQDPHAEDLFWRYKQQQQTPPIEMQFGHGFLRIDSANLYDQFYLPGPSCR